jgi:hypothetical protein
LKVLGEVDSEEESSATQPLVNLDGNLPWKRLRVYLKWKVFAE